MPLIATVVFVLVGVAPVVLNDAGPLQLNVTPAVALVAPSVKVLPLQMGELLDATGVAGGVGSDNVIGPATILEIQPFKVTVKFV
jgi:hypothetical protein